MTVEEMVKAYLEANGFDGLYAEDQCACKKDDLAPCGEMQEDCRAGYLGPCDCGEEHEFHIGPEREEEAADALAQLEERT